MESRRVLHRRQKVDGDKTTHARIPKVVCSGYDDVKKHYPDLIEYLENGISGKLKTISSGITRHDATLEFERLEKRVSEALKAYALD